MVRVVKTNVEVISAQYVDSSRLDITLTTRIDTLARKTITGTNLWKLSVWGSAVPNNTRNKIGFLEQTLDGTQMATPLAFNESVYHSVVGTLGLENVKVTLDCGESLKTVKYICVKFGHSKAVDDSTNTWYKIFGFNKHTIVRQPANLIGCTKLKTSFAPLRPDNKLETLLKADIN